MLTPVFACLPLQLYTTQRGVSHCLLKRLLKFKRHLRDATPKSDLENSSKGKEKTRQ